MSVRIRLSKTKNLTLLSSFLGILVMLIVGNSFNRDALHLFAIDEIQSYQQLPIYTQSDKNYAMIRSSNIVNTEIHVTIDELFGEKNYYGYVAQLDDKYFLFFSSKEYDSTPRTMILSKWWSQFESMNVFRQMVVDDLSKSSDLTAEEVDSLVYSQVFLDADAIIESSLPLALLWGFVLFILSLIFYKSLKMRLGLFSEQIESVVLDYDLGYLNIIYSDKFWTIGEKHIIYHGRSFKILNIDDIREVQFFENRVSMYFKEYKATIYATMEKINLLAESWKIQRRHHNEPVNQL